MQSSPELEHAHDVCIETMGRMAEFWGFTRTMGRVFGFLFLSPRAVTQQELVEALGVSTANVSMSLKGLSRWGAVHKTYEKGDRKAHYAAETEIRKIVRNVIGGRERRTLSEAFESFTEALAVFRKAARAGGLSDDERHMLERIEHLESVLRVSNRLLEMLLRFGRVDVEKELESA